MALMMMQAFSNRMKGAGRSILSNAVNRNSQERVSKAFAISTLMEP
ncbi:unnamed protein product [Brassica oleracea var. botrytis]